MTTQAQIIAVEPSARQKASEAEREFNNIIRNEPLFTGLHRTYRPFDDEDVTYPDESNPVDVPLMKAFEDYLLDHVRLFDVVATKDFGNLSSLADIEIDDVLLYNVPVHYLLFLEKQLRHIREVVLNVPTLSRGDRWNEADMPGYWETDPATTLKSRKVPKTLVKYEATPEHPAQVDVYHEDNFVGEWTTRKLSGALSSIERDNMVRRIDSLLTVVVEAREKANSTEVDNIEIGQQIIDYILDR